MKRRAVERLDGEATGQQTLDDVRVVAPMQEGELVPAMLHAPPLDVERAHAVVADDLARTAGLPPASIDTAMATLSSGRLENFSVFSG